MKVKNINQFKTRIDSKGRVCTACGKYKIWNEFKGHTRSATGRSSKCKECYKLGRKTEGRTKERLTDKKRRQTLKKTNPLLWRARNIRSSLMTRARKLGMDRSDIPKGDEIKSWLEERQPFKDYYTGLDVPFSSINIDHIVPLSRGGTNTFDNLCITDHKINSAKGQMTGEEFKSLLELMSTWEDKGNYVLMRLRQGFMGKR